MSCSFTKAPRERMELEFTQTEDRLEIASPMPVGRRVFFGLIALVPLLAPYELMLGVRWNSWLHPFFFLAAVISLGALALTGLFVFAALAGLESRMIFDRTQGRFTYSASAPIVPLRSQHVPIASLLNAETETHNWSDGAPSYSLRVVTTDGRQFTTSSSSSRQEIEDLRTHVLNFLQSELSGTAIPR
jgi:hypothetical protein